MGTGTVWLGGDCVLGNEAQSAGPRLAPQGLRWAGLMAPPTYWGRAGWLRPHGGGAGCLSPVGGAGQLCPCKGAHAQYGQA